MTTTLTRPPETRRPASSKSRIGSLVARIAQTARGIHIFSWVLILGAIVVLAVFAVQTFATVQEVDYHGNWHGAQWIVDANSAAPIAYFRKSFSLEASPDNAFLTVQGRQFYRLYVDGVPIDDTTNNFRSGVIYDTNIYDVTPFLHSGANAIAVRVDNGGDRGAAFRAVLGLQTGSFTQYLPSDTSWRSTADSSLTAQPAQPGKATWSSPTFVDSSWDTAQIISPQVIDGLITLDPITFETPLPTQWLSVGPYQDAFFYRSVTIPDGSMVWLRIATTGNATVYLNGGQALLQPPSIPTDQTGGALPPGVYLTTGVYNVTPYVHSGVNSLAVHVAAASTAPSTFAQGLQTAAASMDLLAVQPNGAVIQIAPDASWQGSPVSNSGWTTGTGTAHWNQPLLVDQSVYSSTPPYRVPNPQAEQVSVTTTATVAGITSALVLAFCVLFVLLQRLIQGAQFSVSEAIHRTALVVTPPLALTCLFGAVSLEPAIPNPFPNAPLWFAIVIVVGLITAAVLLVKSRVSQSATTSRLAAIRSIRVGKWSLGTALTAVALVMLTLATAFLAFYKLDYESYWQDELVSLAAARGVLQYGIPRWVTGVIYTKSELFSYTLAPVMAIFGTNPYALRGVSAAEHVVTVVLLYFIGRQFVGKIEALVASSLLAFSAFALQWARTLRMYQQAQMLVLIVIFLFYKAVQPNAKKRYIYLSMFAVVVMYLSHEETYIILPSLVIYLFVAQGFKWMRNRHWWIAGLSAMACIVAQLAWWKLTRHPVLGTDSTSRPFVGFYPTNAYFYIRLLFAAFDKQSLFVNNYFGGLSVFTIIGMLVALFMRNAKLRYLSLLLVLPLGLLSVAFSLTSPRYFFPIFPFMILLASVGLGWTVRTLLTLAQKTSVPSRARGVVIVCSVLLFCALLFSEILPIGGYVPSVSIVLPVPYTHQNPDYQRAGDYIQAHWKTGDILIANVAAVDAAFYAEQPAYAFYNSKVLYVLEQNGHVVESYEGVQMMLNAHDFQQVLETHHRIWIMSIYTNCCGPSFDSTVITQNFQMVFEGQHTFVYLRGG